MIFGSFYETKGLLIAFQIAHNATNHLNKLQLWKSTNILWKVPTCKQTDTHFYLKYFNKVLSSCNG